MDFGLQFFPCVGPEDKSAHQYWQESLALVRLCDELGYTNVRTVEHYFRPYGGYSPNPLTFLSAAAMCTAKARLITGAVLPVFNNPLKLAGEIGMVDAISGGRLEVGFARAFLPHEFARFGISPDESRARFAEGMEQVRRLLAEENVSSEGRFHSFRNVTSLPRPTQQPHPPFWIAAIATPESFIQAGKAGFAVMCVPFAGGRMRELLSLYREAWCSAGHPGNGRIMLSFHMFCAETFAQAELTARGEFERYLRQFVAAASEWLEGTSSTDYPGYDKLIANLDKETFDSQLAKNVAWIGTPETITKQIVALRDELGEFDIASLQVNFSRLSFDDASRSMRLFAREVMPKFRTD
jgi:alkanesulfonate monooxygenase SsuD/methylene tetrahydromethanopterin reductase-like flavin-dependent oxidoreductase (luciferase family)